MLPRDGTSGRIKTAGTGLLKWESRLTISFFVLQGHLDTYRFCDDVWTFLIKDVTFKLDNQTSVTADKVKIVSCNSKRPGEA